ncbi:MAG: N-acetyltransferase [Acidobacteriia bacterium]|jgi:putative acetyltransferase|nr:N-acetyltransferase [Terriglobia bacterium]
MGIVYRKFAPGDESAFRDLNEEWIRNFFVLEPKDVEVLNSPKELILDTGGAIFIAEQDGKAVGCCALIAMGAGTYEVSKMAVSPVAQGQGIGRKLLVHLIESSRVLGAARLCLDTNTKLQSAVHLYESLGFTAIPQERGHYSAYARSNLAMELFLA